MKKGCIACINIQCYCSVRLSHFIDYLLSYSGRSASAGNKTLHNSPVDYGMEPRINTDLAYSSNTEGGDGGEVRFIVKK